MPAADSNTVLVVDDTPASLGVLVPTLEEAGFGVLVATNGLQTCRRLEQHEALRDIPVIFMTALHSNGTARRAVQTLSNTRVTCSFLVLGVRLLRQTLRRQTVQSSGA